MNTGMTSVITNVQEFDRRQKDWDALVATNSTNWHMFSHVIRSFMLRHQTGGEFPVIMLQEVDGKAVGLSAFRIQRRYGIGFSSFLMPAFLSPDFVVVPEYRDSFVDESLRFLLKRMKCQVITMYISRDSPQMAPIKDYCKVEGLRTASSAGSSYSIIPVKGEWAEFEAARGSNFRNHFKKIEGKLTRLGEWKTFQAKANSAESAGRIAAVEAQSWKHQGGKAYSELDIGLTRYTEFADTPSMAKFAPEAWFLELDGKPISYAIGVEINGVACLTKTSFDNRYRNLYAGEYVQNVAIRSLYDRSRVDQIELMVRLPYHRRWTAQYGTRDKLQITRGGVYSGLEYLYRKLPLSQLRRFG